MSVNLIRGDLVGVEEHFARWGGLLDAVDYRQIPGTAAAALGVASFCAVALGNADSARDRIARAIASARDSKNPYELTVALGLESWMSRLLRDPRRAEVSATQSLALVEEHGFYFVGNMVRAQYGWARARLGSAPEGVALIRQGSAGFAESGNRLYVTDRLTGLAETQALDGKIDEALATIQEALQTNPEEAFFRSNALTLRGDLRLKLGQTELAEADFREAIALAQKMQAKAWELRAITSLGRLLDSQGRRDEARAMLAVIYGWFTEGFDTADLIDAKALLDELSA